MDKINKIICGLGSIAAIGYGTYKVFTKKPPKYSINWIKNLTDNEWELEREIVRQKYCNPKYDDDVRIDLHNLLMRFDKIKSARDWAGITPQGPSYHREDGYNLYKP